MGLTTTSDETAALRSARAERLARDGSGRLFDPVVRDLERRRGSSPAALHVTETLAAMFLAAKLAKAVVEHRLEHLDLTLPQFRALMIIGSEAGSGMQLGRLAGYCHITPRTITGIVDGLAAAGLVERVADPADRRAVVARLTPEGRRRAESAAEVQRRAMTELLAGVDRAEREQLRDLCLRVVQTAGQALAPRRAQG